MAAEGLGISIRGLTEGGGTPLRDFRGTLDSFASEPATGYDGTRINLNFREVEVIASTEPYNFPTAVLNIGQNNKKKSKWGYFAESMAELIDQDEDIDQQVGKSMRLVMCDGQDGRPAGKPIWQKDADREKYPNGEVPSAVWTVTEVEGKVAGGSHTTPEERARMLLDGKTLPEFNKAAYADPIIRQESAKDLQRSITDKSFITALLTTKEFTKDAAGVYHREDMPF